MGPKKSPDLPQQPDIICPECQNHLHSELVSILLKGKTVYCEICGFPFQGIEAGEVKPLEKKSGHPSSQKNLTKEEVQWIKWKKAWNTIKTDLSNAFSDVFSSKKPEREIVQNEHQEDLTQNSIYRRNSEEKFNPSSKEPIQKSNYSFENESNTIRNINTSIKILVDLTPFFYAFIILMTILSSIGRHSYFGLVSSLIIEVFIIIYDHKEFLPQEKEQKVHHAGIPMIIFGLFSVGYYGIGTFLLARGILNLIVFIKETEQISQNHPAIKENPKRKAIWIREIIFSFIPFIFEMFIVFFASAIIQDLGKLILSGKDLSGFLYTIISGSIVIVIIYQLVIPSLKNQPIEKIPVEKSIILIICGMFALNTGAGFYLLVIGILILVFQSSLKSISGILPDVLEIREIAEDIVINPIEIEKSPELNHPIKIRKFDPETGEPLEKVSQKGDMYKKSSSIPNEKVVFQENIKISQENIKVVPKTGEITSLIFTVLEPEIRKKLMNLLISEQEKDEISKSLLYLNPKEQEKYLNEVDQANVTDYDYYSKYIKRIQALSLPKDQQDFLIQQLNYLPDEELEDFIKILESNIDQS